MKQLIKLQEYADAVIAVYPFTPTMQITSAIIDVAQRPVFAGVGGGTTAGPRVREIALDAELHGATAVVLINFLSIFT